MPIEGLEFQPVDIKFNEGLDTKTQAKLVLPGKWLDLFNVSMSRDWSINRRDGILSLHPNVNGNGLATHDAQMFAIAGPQFISIAANVSPYWAAGAPGIVAYVDVTRDSAIRHSTASQDSPDMALGGGCACYVWREVNLVAGTSSGISLLLVDEKTGTRLISTILTSATSAHNPRVVYADNVFFVFYATIGTDIRCTIINPATVGVGSPVALVSSANFNNTINFDCCGIDKDVALIYGWMDGTNSVLVTTVKQTAGVPALDNGPVEVTTQAELGFLNVTGMTVCRFPAPDDDNILCVTAGVGADPNSGLSISLQDTALSLPTGATLVDATIGPGVGPVFSGVNVVATGYLFGGGASVIQIFWDEFNAYDSPRLNQIRSITISTVGIVTAGATFMQSNSFRINAAEASGPQGPWICGKPFTNSVQSTFLPVCVLENYGSPGANVTTLNQQSSFFLMDGINGVVVGRALYGSLGVPILAGNSPGAPCSAPIGARDEYDAFGFVLTERPSLAEFANGVNQTQTGLCRMTLRPNITRAPSKTQLGRSTYLAGGVLTQYDGAAVSNHGFPLFPEGCSAVAVNGGVNLNTVGVHQVCFIYEWLDAQGQRHQSAPSIPISVTFFALGHCDCLIPTLQLAGVIPTQIRIVPYVTQAGGLTFNRVFKNNSVATPLMNTLGATTVAFRINGADTEWVSNEPLYNQPTQSGTTLPNVAPPPCSALVSHQNRLFINAADNPGAWRYSQQIVNGVGLQWNNQLGGTLPVEAGNLVGFSTLDEKLIIFAEHRIYAVYGTGPDSSGANSNYSTPTVIPSDVGCSEMRSILRTPVGVLFKSPKGWYLVGRDLTVKYIGAPVAYADANPVQSAVMLEDRQECRLTTGGATLVYNYIIDQWSVSICAAAYVPRDAIWWPTISRYCTIGADFGVTKEEPGQTYDNFPGHTLTAPAVTNIQMVMRTSWLKVGSINGFQRMRWLYLTATGAVTETDHQRGRVVLRCEFDDIFAAQQIAVGPGGYEIELKLVDIPMASPLLSYDLRHKLKRQKCKSVSFTIYDSSTLTGWQSLQLQVGVKRGTNKLPAAQGIG